MKIETYDPSLGQNFVLPCHSTEDTFSSLESNFFVQDSIGDVDLIKWKKAIEKCIEKTSSRGFFTVIPWFPGAKKLKQRLYQEFINVEEINGSLFCYFEPSKDTIDKLFELRNEYGGDVSGEWCIGGCIIELPPPSTKKQYWDFSYLLKQADKIGCLLSLGEMQQTFFMSKPFEGLKELLLIQQKKSGIIGTLTT